MVADVMRKDREMSPLKTSSIMLLLVVVSAYSEGTNVLDDMGDPVVPEGMVRLHHASGMRHGGYYTKFVTVVDVPTNVYLKSSDWTPQSQKPIPLAVHQACDIYAKWRALNNSDTTSFYRIEIQNFALTTNSRMYGVDRWYYVIWHTPHDPLYILLDGTLLLPKEIDLRTQAEKDAYDQMLKARDH